MSELAELEAAMKALCQQLSRDAEELKTLFGQFVERASKPSRSSSSWQSQSSAGQKKKKEEKPSSQKEKKKVPPLVDFEIPSCYGTVDLRETLIHAGKKLTEGSELLTKTRQQMPSQYVQREMDELLTNFVVLKEALAQMWERMEMNCEDLPEEPSTPSSKEDLVSRPAKSAT